MEACDKGGNFIGWLYYEGQNLSIALLQVCLNLCDYCVLATTVVSGCGNKWIQINYYSVHLFIALFKCYRHYLHDLNASFRSYGHYLCNLMTAEPSEKAV